MAKERFVLRCEECNKAFYEGEYVYSGGICRKCAGIEEPQIMGIYFEEDEKLWPD